MLKSSLLIFCFVVLSSCSSQKNRLLKDDNSPKQTEAASSPEMGPGIDQKTSTEEFGPQVENSSPVHLILPAAGALGFSYAGILKELFNQDLVIGEIIATEIGALISAMYLTSASTSEFEWKLQKLKTKRFILKQGMMSVFTKNLQKNNELNSLINELFGDQRLEDLKPTLKIVSYDTVQKRQIIFKAGLLKNVLAASQVIPNWIEPQSKEQSEWQASSNLLSNFVDYELDKNNVTIPVVIENSPTMNLHNDSMILEDFYRKSQTGLSPEASNLVMRIKANAFIWTDYDKRSEIMFLGSQAVLLDIDRIKKAANHARN